MSESIEAAKEARRMSLIRQRRWRTELKGRVFEAYGGAVCACCGEDEFDFMTIDHIDGGGRADRVARGAEASGVAFYRSLEKDDYPPGFQVLCWNCNAVRGNFGGCPHRRLRVEYIRLHPDAKEPSRAYVGDVGHDLHIVEPTTIAPGDQVDIPTGIAISVPAGYWAEIVGRSSAIRRYGLMVIPGVIDSGFRGELKTRVWNVSEKTVSLQKWTRLAQVIVSRVPSLEVVEVAELSATDRGESGFGSSGT